MPSLFRPEVVEGRRQGWLGSIQLIRPVSFTVLTTFVIATTVTVVSYLSYGEYTRKARVSGYLVPDRGVIRLVTPQPATVLERHAVEGQTVRLAESAGRIVFDIDMKAARDAGLSVSARLLRLARKVIE